MILHRMGEWWDQSPLGAQAASLCSARGRVSVDVHRKNGKKIVD